MAATPQALQLRLLQTIVEVAAEKNSTLVLPFPVELLRFLDQATGKPNAPEAAPEVSAGPEASTTPTPPEALAPPEALTAPAPPPAPVASTEPKPSVVPTEPPPGTPVDGKRTSA